jgi:DNA-binding NarL/FixJ family response regulator
MVGTTSCTVVVGRRDHDQLAGLQAELVARGHDVVVLGWPVDRLIERAARSVPVVLVLAGDLSDRDLRAVARGVEKAPGLAVVMLGPMQRRLEVLVALASGVSGYLPADSDAATIADVVDALVSGVVLLPPGTVFSLVRSPLLGARGITVDRMDGRRVELTHREWDVLVLVRQAYSTAEIARRLVIAGVTVRTHVAALVRKLGVEDRAALVGAAVEAGVLRKTSTLNR